MKFILPALLLLPSSSALADMSNLRDYRTSNINLLLDNYDTQSAQTLDDIRSYHNWTQALDESITLEITTPGVGSVMGAIDFTAYATTTAIASTTSISAASNVTNATPFVNAAFSNAIRFDLTHDTQFQLDASFESHGRHSGGSFRIRQRENGIWSNVLSFVYLDQTDTFSQLLTLGPGEYEFAAASWASATDLLPNNAEFATSIQDTTFRIVPAPASLSMLALFTLASTRRSRT